MDLIRSVASTSPTSNILTNSDCTEILNDAIASANAAGVKVCVAIVDAGGNLLAFHRMIGSWIGSIDIAQRKAYTATAFSSDMSSPAPGPLTTEAIADLAQPGQPLYGIEATNFGKITIVGGGIPLYKNKTLVGAVGVSGADVKTDISIAEAASAKFKSR